MLLSKLNLNILVIKKIPKILFAKSVPFNNEFVINFMEKKDVKTITGNHNKLNRSQQQEKANNYFITQQAKHKKIKLTTFYRKIVKIMPKQFIKKLEFCQKILDYFIFKKFVINHIEIFLLNTTSQIKQNIVF